MLDNFEGKLQSLNSVTIDEASQVLYISDNGPITPALAGKSILLGHKIGRILKFDLKTKTTSVLIDQIAFSNGIVY